MQITFIGTGSGKASLSRHHSAIVIDSGDHKMLLDAGDGINRSLLGQDIDPLQIDSILISHFHPDHVGGITSLVNQMKIFKRTKPLSIFINNNLKNALINLLNMSYIFPEKLGFSLNTTGFIFDDETPVTEKIKFFSKQNQHVTNKHSIPHLPDSLFVSASFMILLDNHKVVYTADIGHPDDLYLFPDKKPKLFITEATHVGIKDVLEAVQYLLPENTYITHIDESNEAALKEFAFKNKSLNIFLAADGEKITL
jgi:ribonuclease BN (tRNA processing enzyme)